MSSTIPRAQGGSDLCWFDVMWRVEMVAVRVGLRREIGKDAAEAFGHAPEVVRIAQTTKREIDLGPRRRVTVPDRVDRNGSGARQPQAFGERRGGGDGPQSSRPYGLGPRRRGRQRNLTQPIEGEHPAAGRRAVQRGAIPGRSSPGVLRFRRTVQDRLCNQAPAAAR